MTSRESTPDPRFPEAHDHGTLTPWQRQTSGPLDVVVAGLSVVDILGRPVDLASLPRRGGLQVIDTDDHDDRRERAELRHRSREAGVPCRGDHPRRRRRVRPVRHPPVRGTRYRHLGRDRGPPPADLLHVRGGGSGRGADVPPHAGLHGELPGEGPAGSHRDAAAIFDPRVRLPGPSAGMRAGAPGGVRPDQEGRGGADPPRYGRESPPRSPAAARAPAARGLFPPELRGGGDPHRGEDPRTDRRGMPQGRSGRRCGGQTRCQGCYVDHDGRSAYIPARRVRKVVDATGAGDAFVAGFLAATIRGADPFGAARFGNAVAASCVTAVGASTAIRRFEEYPRIRNRAGRGQTR